MTVINTTTLGKNVQGYIGSTPLKIYIEKNKVVKIEALKNQETPKYFIKVKGLKEGHTGIDVSNGDGSYGRYIYVHKSGLFLDSLALFKAL